MDRRTLMLGGAASLLTGCAGRWEVGYEAELDPAVTRSWRLNEVIVSVPDHLVVSEANSYAPNADIVWHGEPPGDRRAQVTGILEEAITAAADDLAGPRDVSISAQVERFHAVTPVSVSRAPGAVHNIIFRVQVFDAHSIEPITEPVRIHADLEAYVGAAAVTAAVQGQTQRVRIVRHLTRVTRGWLGTGPDQRHSFTGFGR